jgi:hypothetical protein
MAKIPYKSTGRLQKSNQNSQQNQRKSLVSKNERVRLTVIGDVVFDKIVLSQDYKPHSFEEHPGGALFVKRFLALDPVISSKADIYGYIGPSDDMEAPKNKPYIQIKKQINTIPLVKQDVYRISSSTTETNEVDDDLTFEFQTEDVTQQSSLSMLVVTDLGISSKRRFASESKSDLKTSFAGIGERKILHSDSCDKNIHDQYEWEWHLDAAYQANKTTDANSSVPWHFITISNPTESLFDQASYSYFKRNLEPEKISYIRSKTLAIVYGDHLRSCCNLAIARRISIERTAQDFLQELHTNPLLSELGKFEHLVVRFGLLSVVHSYRIKNRRFHRLFFDPKHIYDSKYSTKLSGVVTGNQTVLLDNIIRQLLVLSPEERNNPYDVTERIGVGIKLGIKDCKVRYDNGYGDSKEKALEFLNPTHDPPAFVPKFFTAHSRVVDENLAVEEKKAEEIADERIPIAHTAWSILAQSAEYKLLQSAEDIVSYGVDRAVNQGKPVWAPIARFGRKKEMVVLERYELESYRSVQLLMEEAMNPENKSILSIAVFGPPGSGKSFVSERIANSACQASDVRPVLKKINLASISDSEKLTDKINQHFLEYKQQDAHDEEEYKRDEGSNKLPRKKLQLILFFDEFDCTVNDKNLGWLKTFLPMMQDGEFSMLNNTLETDYHERYNQPILIFAGGTSYTYSSFSRHDSVGDPEDQLRFAQAKGPDFVSRLRGHIDILGPGKTSELDEGYVTRRAILLRTSFIKRIKELDKSINGNSNLDPYLYKPFVRAMLTISKYKHGARSMEAIIKMCGMLPGGRITAASIPPHAQLNMHVDANEFLKLVRSYS